MICVGLGELGGGAVRLTEGLAGGAYEEPMGWSASVRLPVRATLFPPGLGLNTAADEGETDNGGQARKAKHGL